MPVTLQFGLVKIYQSGMFAVVDSLLAIQMKDDGWMLLMASIFLPNTAQVQGLCGENNVAADNDLRTSEEEAVDAPNLGWSWRVPHQEA